MGHGKKESIKRQLKKLWSILNGTYKPKKKPIGKEDVELLIAAVQQECYWTERDIQTFEAIQNKQIDWSGDVRSKRRTGKNIRRRS
jgi:hypothetical protein